MWDSLSKKFTGIFSSLSKAKTFTEENLTEAVREVRLALLEADVSYPVASQFVKRVKEAAVGQELLRSVTPTQQFVKILHDELVRLMGGEEVEFALKGPRPFVILLCGLQGAGKTTHCAKLAAYCRKKKLCQKPLLVASDLQRPAAVEQLRVLAQQADLPFFSVEGCRDPLVVARQALRYAREQGSDLVLVDTAGRLHIDEELMEELTQLRAILAPQEVILIANAATGQDAVKTALEFDRHVGITGTILSMLDGSARAGAALSISEATQKPLLFEGIGEKIDDLQLFNPKSMADRILGMGDVINLVRKAEEHISEEERGEFEEKMRKASFTYDDYRRQMGMVRRMGSFRSLMKMFPGAPDPDEFAESEKEFHKLEAMIGSMTPSERKERVELDQGRRRRIAAGSGSSVDDVNRMVKSFKQMKKMLKQGMLGPPGALPDLPDRSPIHFSRTRRSQGSRGSRR